MNRQELTKTINECLSLQNTFNAVVNPNWRTSNYNFRRASWIEASELIDHMGYKWWKNQQQTDWDRKQALLEVVDIYHFVLSVALIEGKTGDDLYHNYTWATKHVKAPSKETKIRQIEEFVMVCLEGSVMYGAFFQILVALELSVEDLQKYYLGKNALNKFRQDNGYKSGIYQKQWNFNGEIVEDNKVLEHILESSSVTNFDTIYSELNAIYATMG